MFKACIFDLDGTLTDTLESLTYSVNRTLEILGYSPISRKQCEAFVGNGARVLVQNALQVSGDPQGLRLEEACQVYGQVFGEYCTYQVRLYDGIAKMIQSLKEKGMRLAVLTNKPHLQAVDVVNHFFAPGVFDKVEGQQEGIPRKPDPTALIHLADTFSLSCEECVYVGDSEVDMKTGLAAGMKTVGVTWGFRDRDVLESHGAHRIIDRPEELLDIVEGKE